MARPIWTGFLSFGLVNVPVAVYSAAEDKTVHFHQFQAGTSDRIRLEIAGRSKMDRNQLADAIRKAERRSRKTAS